MPGPSDTALFEKAGMGDTRVGAGPKDDHAEVARAGVEALMAGRERATASSLRTRLEAVLSRFVPDAVKAELHRRMARAGVGAAVSGARSSSAADRTGSPPRSRWPRPGAR